MIPEGSKVTMTVGPDTYEYTAGKAQPLPFNKESRDWIYEVPLNKFANGGIIPKPSVGRIVHYHPKEGAGPYAAIVTAVVEDAVALQIFWPSWVVEEPRESLRTPFSLSPKPGHWSWPPRG